MPRIFNRLFKEKYLGVRWKLVLPLLGTFLLLAIIMSPLIRQMVNNRIEEEADRRLGEIADSVGKLIENSEYQARSSAILLARQPEVQQAFSNLERNTPILLEEKDTLRLQELSLYEANYGHDAAAYFYGGPPITRRLQVSADGQILRDNLLHHVNDTRSPTSGVIISPQNSQIIGVAPVFDPKNGQMIGIILVAFYMDQDYLDNISQIIDTDLALVKDNTIIGATIDPVSGYEKLAKEGWLESSEFPAVTVEYKTGAQYRLLGHPLEISGTAQGYVMVAQPIDELFAVSRNIQAIFFILLGIFILTALWFWVAAFITFTRPLSQLTKATTSISQGDLTQRVDISYLLLRDEITVLSENFNAMAEHLSGLYASLEERVELRTQELVEERNKLEDAMEHLSEARDQAVAANKSKSEFISIVSHELKIPMTSIKGYSDLMLSGATGALNDMQSNFLKTIRGNVNRMATLVSDLADISRLETGNLRLDPVDVNAQDVLEEIVNLSQTQIEQKKQTIHLEFPDNLPRVWCDRNRLSQILTNLVSNANKYTPESGTIWVQACVTTQNTPEGKTGMVEIRVKDNGLGMTPEDQSKLFSKFFRSADDKVREAPGTGLGLSITKNLIELQGGRIWFESEFRKGTTFFFTLPVYYPEQDE